MTITCEANFKDVVSKLEATSRAYLRSETITMDDATYDPLLREVGAAGIALPEWSVEVSSKVAAGGRRWRRHSPLRHGESQQRD